MRVKICGLTSVADATEVARCGADFAGLVLAPSPRHVPLESAAQIAAALPATTQPVLVFRDATREEVLGALSVTGCTWLQLHGRESVSYLSAIRQRRPQVRLVRAWELATPQAPDELLDYLRQADAARVRIDIVLLDAPKGGAHPGFERLGDISLRCHTRPPEVWCAGGLTASNLVTAVASGRYNGVDVASGVESRPGVKDHIAVQQFIAMAKRL